MTASGPSGLASAACGNRATKGLSPAFGSDVERDSIEPRNWPMPLSWSSQTSYELAAGVPAPKHAKKNQIPLGTNARFATMSYVILSPPPRHIAPWKERWFSTDPQPGLG